MSAQSLGGLQLKIIHIALRRILGWLFLNPYGIFAKTSTLLTYSSTNIGSQYTGLKEALELTVLPNFCKISKRPSSNFSKTTLLVLEMLLPYSLWTHKTNV